MDNIKSVIEVSSEECKLLVESLKFRYEYDGELNMYGRSSIIELIQKIRKINEDTIKQINKYEDISI